VRIRSRRSNPAMFRLFGRTAVTANSPSRASPLSDNRCVMISIRLQPLCYRQGAMSLNAEKCQNSIARSAFTSAKVSPSFRLNRNAFFPTKAAKLWWASDRIFALLYGDAQDATPRRLPRSRRATVTRYQVEAFPSTSSIDLRQEYSCVSKPGGQGNAGVGNDWLRREEVCWRNPL
jgi:hypothetical protein